MTDLFKKLLAQRGLTQDFLHPEYSVDVQALPDMDKAVRRILRAIDGGETIMIYGDYDADGVTAATLMQSALMLAGAKKVTVMLPDRFLDGYGMSMRAAERAQADGATLVVTVDCGANNGEVITALKKLGIDTVVTDHHELNGEVPADAAAVVDAKRRDFYDEKNYATLCGCGAAFVVACALKEAGRIPDGQEKWLLDLAAIGTICDNMDLSSEINRMICFYGSKVLSKTRRPGLKALTGAAGIREFNSFSIGFQIGPRLNAAGRLKSAELSYELLSTRSRAKAAELAEELNKLNTLRKNFQTQAVNEIEKTDPAGPVIVASGKWHEGIVGIVAGRLTEKYHRPAFVLAETKKGVLKGSGRTWGSFDLSKALAECRPFLLSGGGHAGACGLSLEPEQLNNFCTAVNKYYESLGLPEDDGAAQARPDLILDSFEGLTEEFFNELSGLEPFGEGNPEPVFGIRNVFVQDVRRMGADGNSLRLTLRDVNKKIIQIVAFSAPEEWLRTVPGEYADVCFKVRKNEWRGTVRIEGEIADLKRR